MTSSIYNNISPVGTGVRWVDRTTTSPTIQSMQSSGWPQVFSLCVLILQLTAAFWLELKNCLWCVSWTIRPLGHLLFVSYTLLMS